MEKRVRSILFLAVLAGVAVANIYRMRATPVVLERESRRPADWPAWNPAELRDGTFTRKVEDAFADRFVGREEVPPITRLWSRVRGLPSRKVEIVAATTGNLYAAGTTASMPPAVGPDSAFFPALPATTTPAALVVTEDSEWVNQFLSVGDRAYETAGYSEKAADYYARTIEEMATAMDPSVAVYVVLVPSAVEFVTEDRYRSVTYPQKTGIDSIYAKLSSRVTAIDVYAELSVHSGEYLYNRTDPHWTGLGAWYAYRAASAVLGFEPYPYEDYPKEQVPGFLGFLYSATLSQALKDNPDTLELVIPFAEHAYTVREGDPVEGKAVSTAYVYDANKYLAYLAGDQGRADIVSTVTNGRRILIVKDSFANAFIPYLIPHYEEIHIIDPRHWQGSLPAFVKQHHITEVMVFNYYLVVSVYTGFAQSLLYDIRLTPTTVAPAEGDAAQPAAQPVSPQENAGKTPAPDPSAPDAAAPVAAPDGAPPAPEPDDSPAAAPAENAPPPASPGVPEIPPDP